MMRTMLIFSMGVASAGLYLGRLDIEALTVAPAPEEAPPVPDEVLATVPQPGWTARGTVVAVHDGDTITVTIPKTYHIRLRDCWAPEVTGEQKPQGIKARDNLRKFAMGQPVTVQVSEDAKDIGKSTSMGRFLGYAWVHGMNLSEMQVAGGFAGRTKPDESKLLKKED